MPYPTAESDCIEGERLLIHMQLRTLLPLRVIATNLAERTNAETAAFRVVLNRTWEAFKHAQRHISK